MNSKSILRLTQIEYRDEINFLFRNFRSKIINVLVAEILFI